MKLFSTSTLLTAAAATTIGLSVSASTFNGGNILDAGNWSAGFPNGATVGTIDVNGTFNIGNNVGTWSATGSVVIDSGAVISASGDWGHANLTQSTVNSGTINASDDIFSNSSVMTFNAGSSGNANDDFEANGSSTININGGTHTAGDYFGAQNNSTVNLTGGNITAGRFRVAATGGNWTLGGSTVLTGDGDATDLQGVVAVSSGWSGSWTITGLSGTDWQTEVTGGDYTLDGNVVDGTIFANNFVVSNSGQTLSVIPEPSSLALLGLGGLLMMRRRHSN